MSVPSPQRVGLGMRKYWSGGGVLVRGRGRVEDRWSFARAVIGRCAVRWRDDWELGRCVEGWGGGELVTRRRMR